MGNFKHLDKNSLKFIGSALGIIIFYSYSGLVQDVITKGKYRNGKNTEKFVYATSLVFAQCLVNFIYAIILHQTYKKPKPTDKQVDIKLYRVCSLTTLLGMVTGSMALQWVSYPTQVLAKSSKPLFVVVFGTLFGGKRYSPKTYGIVLLIVIGIAFLMYKPSSAAGAVNSSMTGEMLLLMSLAMGGLTGAVNEKMRAGHQRPNSATMMKMINLYSIMYSLLALIGTGEIISFSQFCTRHPAIIWEILSLSAASALGQFCIYVMISEFGVLPCAIVTTARKFFTVFASVLFFGNMLLGTQWIGVGLVFLGLGLELGVYKGKEI